jgi:hypothetical protein
MISLTRLRDLDLATTTSPGRPLHLSAASGLVCIGDWFYVVADDELHLGAFRANSHEPGSLIRLFEGELPDSKPKRKKRKPDLEALTRLPPSEESPFGALLALGSGSRPNRRAGALLGLDASGGTRGAARPLDLSELFALLDQRFTALNIEGAVVMGEEFCLLQRGNKTMNRNAVIRYPLSAIVAALQDERVGAIEPLAIDDFDLGDVGGIPCAFTDGAALSDGRIVFSAVAEDTENSYEDGRCVGAALGVIDRGRLAFVRTLDRPHKIEGLNGRLDGNSIELLLVTDDDDPAIPAGLFSATLEM